MKKKKDVCLKSRATSQNKFLVASPLPPTPGKVFRRLLEGLWRNVVSETFRRLPGELPETPGRAFWRSGGGHGGAGQEEAREDSREAREDSREDSREYSREEPGGGQGVVNSHKSEGGGSLSGSPPQLLRNKLYRPRALLIVVNP